MTGRPERALGGVVPLEGRGALPLLELHREPMFLHAVRALLAVEALAGRIVVTVEPDRRAAVADELRRRGLRVDVTSPQVYWAAQGPRRVVVHDPLCPLVPADFVARTVDAAVGTDAAVVCFRPVTDTIKTMLEDRIVGTIDRDRFLIVASPVVLTVDASDPPPTEDFAALMEWLRARGEVMLRKSPSLGRRVDDPSAVNLLECMDEMARTVRES